MTDHVRKESAQDRDKKLFRLARKDLLVHLLRSFVALKYMNDLVRREAALDKDEERFRLARKELLQRDEELHRYV